MGVLCAWYRRAGPKSLHLERTAPRWNARNRIFAEHGRIRVPGVEQLIASDLDLAVLNLDGLDMGVPDDAMKLRVWQRFGATALFRWASWVPPT